MRAILIFLLLLCSCSPLKRIQRSEKKDSVVVDKTVTELIRNEVERQIGSLSQTIVEFYPPQEFPIIDKPQEVKIRSDSTVAISPLPIKRIIRTEINTQSDKSSVTDSIVHQNIQTQVKTDVAEQIVEKPPAAVSWIKWAAIALVVILIILIVIKLW
ncbi:hypothetical protein [Parabacteroides provencensis]|uniref:hypothetical protein n=1 Tax=Parabacteroides provencensis TaxID=1944636 RepID=UPI001304757B|nr:hypothetical protein [Parabacteroides provencensis]